VHFVESLQLLANNFNYINSTQKHIKHLKSLRYVSKLLDHYQEVILRNEGLAIGSPSLFNIRRTPSQLHPQQHISTQHDMLPQHLVYKNELNCECYNMTLARKNIAS